MSRRTASLTEALSRLPTPKTGGGSPARLLTPHPDSERSFLIEIAAIEIKKRLRKLNEDYVDELMQSIRDHDGNLFSPIILRPLRLNQNGMQTQTAGRYILVMGAHRLAATKKLGWTMIPAFIRDLTPDQAILTEIDENLVRKELTPLERALCIEKRQKIYQQQFGSGFHGGDRRSLDFKGKNQKLPEKNQSAKIASCSFSDQTIADTGLSKRTIHRALKIAKGLSPGVIEQIETTPLAKKEGELYRLARIKDHEEQQTEARNLLNSPPKPTKRRAAKNDGGYQNLISAWQNASSHARKKFTQTIIQASS